MIFTWYTLFLFGGIIYRHRSNIRLLKLTGLTSGIIFLTLYTFYYARGLSTSIFPHKYPPSLYFLAYNTAVITLLYAAGSRIQSGIASHPFVGNTIRFISRHSYSIFFVHIIVLDALHKPTGFWLSDFLIISAATILTVYVLNYSSTALVSFLRIRHHGA